MECECKLRNAGHFNLVYNCMKALWISRWCKMENIYAHIHALKESGWKRMNKRKRKRERESEGNQQQCTNLNVRMPKWQCNFWRIRVPEFKFSQFWKGFKFQNYGLCTSFDAWIFRY